ncbi:unnamed protein product [Linum trigynum]|uniref:Uncharacterized protein n=1 Tax=Linum trigynum TaxID=586398 RepID=A0AAV2GCM7_9ROSI
MNHNPLNYSLSDATSDDVARSGGFMKYATIALKPNVLAHSVKAAEAKSAFEVVRNSRRPSSNCLDNALRSIMQPLASSADEVPNKLRIMTSEEQIVSSLFILIAELTTTCKFPSLSF